MSQIDKDVETLASIPPRPWRWDNENFGWVDATGEESDTSDLPEETLYFMNRADRYVAFVRAWDALGDPEGRSEIAFEEIMIARAALDAP